jgi:hypothetical protein
MCEEGREMGERSCLNEEGEIFRIVGGGLWRTFRRWRMCGKCVLVLGGIGLRKDRRGAVVEVGVVSLGPLMSRYRRPHLVDTHTK